jgi:hypothetical protein
MGRDPAASRNTGNDREGDGLPGNGDADRFRSERCHPWVRVRAHEPGEHYHACPRHAGSLSGR